MQSFIKKNAGNPTVNFLLSSQTLQSHHRPYIIDLTKAQVQQGGAKGAMSPSNFKKIQSFCALGGVFPNKILSFAYNQTFWPTPKNPPPPISGLATTLHVTPSIVICCCESRYSTGISCWHERLHCPGHRCWCKHRSEVGLRLCDHRPVATGDHSGAVTPLFCVPQMLPPK